VKLAVGCLILLAALAAPSAVAGGDHLVVPGTRVGPWHLGMRYFELPHLLRRERRPENLEASGCSAGIGTAAEIDHYAGLRLSWEGATFRKLYLNAIDTTRAGDHTARGLVIGRSTLADARALYPHAGVDRAYKDDLGAKVMRVSWSTGYESGYFLSLGFNARGRLVALGTWNSSC